MGVSLHSILDSTTEGLWSVDLDGLVTYVNQAAVRMFGFESAAEMIGRNSHELVHHTRADGTPYSQVECPIFKAFQEGRPVHLADEVLWRADGTSFFAEYRSVPILEDGVVVGGVTTFIDNTEKRKVQNESQLNREWLAATLRGIGDAVITTDAQSPPRVTFLNPVAETLTGFRLADAVGKPVLEVFNIINQSTGAPAVNPVDRVLREGRIVGLANHTVLVSRNGATYIIEDSAAPILRSDGQIDGVVLVFRDNTEQSLSREREQKLSAEVISVLGSITEAFFSLDRDWIIRSVNDAHVRASRIAREDQLGKDFRKLFLSQPTAQGSKYLAHYEKVMTERVPVAFEDYYEPLSLWTSVRAYPKPDGGIAVFFLDVTEQKRAAIETAVALERLRQSEERLTLALGAARMGTWHIDLASRSATLSPQVAAMVGMSGTEPDVFDAFQRIVHPDDRETVEKALRDAVDLQQPYQQEYRTLGADGSVRWMLARGNVAVDSAGKPTSIMGILMDLTDSRRAQEENEALLAIVNSSNDFIALTDTATRGLFINRGGREICGIGPAEDVRKFLLRDIVAADAQEHLRDVVIPALQKDAHWVGETRYLNQTTGLSVPVHMNAFTLFMPGSRKAAGYATISREISTEIARREELTDAKAEAERANQLKSAFLANMSHEIRTPIGAIMGFSEFLKDPYLPPEDRDRFIDTIVRSGQSLTRIIDDILDLAKVEAGKLDIEQTSFAFHALVSDVVEMFHEAAKRKRIGLELQFGPDVPSRVRSDPTRLRQILTNIIGNAIKFTAEGSVNVSAQCRRTQEGRLAFEIRVKDTGVGLTQLQKQRLFEPFTQADNSTARKFGGTGLGLVLSRRLARALGGDVVIDEGQQGPGSTFVVSFAAGGAPETGGATTALPPLAVKDSAGKNPGVPGATALLAGIRVLLAEDSLDNQFLVRRFLTLRGASVEIANDGAEAIEKMSTGKFDIVLMDIQMPRVDGYEATTTLRSRGFTLPIVALTAHAMAEERQKTKAVGCDDHLTKPLDHVELIKTVARLVNRK